MSQVWARLGLLMALTGCRSEVQVDGTSAGSGGSSASAGTCADWARGTCSYWTRCLPGVMVREFGNNEERCLERTRLTCEAKFLTADSEATPEWLGHCAQALDVSECGAYSACVRPPGRRPAGAACGGDEQCADGFCQPAPNGSCGVCQKWSAAGETCTSSFDCEPSLGCMGIEPHCTPFLGLDEPCSIDKGAPRCQPGTAWCSTGKCIPRLMIGMACDPAYDGCDSDHLLECDKQSHTCVAIDIPGPGEPCQFSATVGCAESNCDGSKCGEAIREGTACSVPGDLCRSVGLQCITGHCAVPTLPLCK